MSPSARDRRRGGIADDDVRRVGLGEGAGVDYFIAGTTKDEGGHVLPNCIVRLYLSASNVLVDTTDSGVSGTFSFTVSDNTTLYYVVAVKSNYSEAESAHTVVGGDTVALVLLAQHAAGWKDRQLDDYLERQIREEEELMMVLQIVAQVIDDEELCLISKAS